MEKKKIQPMNEAQEKGEEEEDDSLVEEEDSKLMDVGEEEKEK